MKPGKPEFGLFVQGKRKFLLKLKDLSVLLHSLQPCHGLCHSLLSAGAVPAAVIGAGLLGADHLSFVLTSFSFEGMVFLAG